MKTSSHDINNVPGAPDGSSFLVQEVVQIGTLRPHPRNARVGDVDLIAQSLRENGQLKPLVVQRSTRHVLCGNHVLAAAASIGMTEIAVLFVDVDDERATKILLIDNKSTDDASYDSERLVRLLKGLPSLEGTGFGADELERLLRETGASTDQLLVDQVGGAQDGCEDGEVDADEDVGEGVVAEPRSRRSPRHPVRAGEVIGLGEHRLVCGDPRDVFAWQRLLQGELAALVFADLRGEQGHGQANGQPAQQSAVGVETFMAAADAHLEPGGRALVVRSSGVDGMQIISAISERWPLLEEIVCLHQADTESGQLFAPAHTQLVLAFKPTYTLVRPLGRSSSQTSVWAEIEEETERRRLSTAVLASALASLTGQRAIIIDAVAVDGAMLFAGQATKRIVHLLQPDPAVCEQIILSWEQACGDPARRVS